MAADTGTDVEQHHHHSTGHRWLDITLAISAVFISLISLFLALEHGRVLEKMVRAESWAFVAAWFSTSNTDYTPHARVIVGNLGVGPAQVETVEIFYRGIPQKTRRELVHAMLNPADPGRRPQFIQGGIVGRVLAAKEEANILDFPVASYSPDEYSAISKAMSDLQFRICYCSVLDECSVLDTRKAHKAVAVKACPVPPVPLRDE